MLFDRRTGAGTVLVQKDDGTLFIQSAPSSANSFSSTLSVSDDLWHHVAITYDQSASGSIEGPNVLATPADTDTRLQIW